MDTTREDRVSQVWYSFEDVEDEHHFLLDCPAYGDVRKKYDSNLNFTAGLFRLCCRLLQAF